MPTRSDRGEGGGGLRARLARQASREARGLMGSVVPSLSGGPRLPSPALLSPAASPRTAGGTARGTVPSGLAPGGVGVGLGCDSGCLGDRAPLTGAVSGAGSFTPSCVCWVEMPSKRKTKK